VEQRLRADGSIDLTITIPEPYEDCPQFFHVTAGVLQAFPRLVGLPDAAVDLILEPRRGIYRVVPPKSRTVFARIVDCARRLLGVRRLVDELLEQRMELNARIRELRATNEELEAALETRNRFLEVVSHELRTPLIGISGGIEALEQARRTEDAGALADLRRSFHRLDEVVADLLEQARARSGGIVVDQETVHLPRLVMDAVARFSDLAADKGIELVLPDVGALPEQVLTDGPRLRRAIGHLVSNAIKFTPSGRVEVRASTDEDQLRLEVADTGPGVPEDQRATLFRAFQQAASSARRRGTGLGLGLSLTRAVMKALGGRVELVETSPRGARFALELPLRALAVAPRAAPAARRPVLVVDDDRVNRRVLTRLLQRKGLEVLTAENGREAIEHAETTPLGFVIMDYEMPVMDGVEATRQIRAMAPELTVIGWSASARAEVREAMRSAGAQAFLDKPMTPDGLTAALDELGLA
jgi:signal transduction histidine kinase/CheY-like chemotaxis protein